MSDMQRAAEVVQEAGVASGAVGEREEAVGALAALVGVGSVALGLAAAEAMMACSMKVAVL